MRTVEPHCDVIRNVIIHRIMSTVVARSTLRSIARASSRNVEIRARRPMSSFRRASTRASAVEVNPSTKWEFRLLYDGGCPLCVREVEFLRAKDEGRGKLSLVDCASEGYDAKENAGIDYETAMATIHGLTPDGTVYTGVEVFKRAYDAVGIGYVYAFTKVPALLRAANAVYDVWAKYRLNVTGRGSLEEHLRARQAVLDGKACGVQSGACEE